MASSVDIRPKQSIKWFRKIRNQLLMVFLTIVGLIIVIGVLSFNSQAASQSAAQKLLSDDTDRIQTATQLQGDISELRRLEEQFILEVQAANRIGFATETYVLPWRQKYVELRDKTGQLNMDSMSESDSDILSIARLDELETTFESIVALHTQRTNLIESSNEAFLVDEWLLQEELAPLRIYALEQGARQLKYVQTGDASLVTAYRSALEQIEPLLAQFGEDQLDEASRTTFEDRHRTISGSLQTLIQLDREVTQQREVFRVNLDLLDDLLGRSIDQTLVGQTEDRLSLSELNQTTTLGILGLVALAGIIAVAYMLNGGRRTLDQITSLESTIDEIRSGNYRARARIISQDETGFVADEMNRVLDVTFSLMQSRDEQDAIQDAIFQFMEDVSVVAEGDLTARARGTHALTNDIALSFNETVVNLQYIIEQIQVTTVQVSAATGQVRNTTQDLVEGSRAQSDYIIDTSAAVDEMAISIQHVSQNSLTSSSVSQQARENALAGTKAVNETIAGMGLIKEQVSLASGQLGRLSDSSQSISTSIALINDIADRTSVLALNATIRALAAGDSGRGFTVVAREIESLASQAAQAAQRVSQLSTQMQLDASETLASMAATQARVQSGIDVAQNASVRLADIEQVSEKLVDVIREISHAAQQQARSSETVARSMNEIADVTQQTSSGTYEAMTSIDNLAQLAEQLQESVSSFKLAEQSN